MISSRFAVPVSILVAVALVPTTIHSYLGLEVRDNVKTEAISPSLAGLGSRPTDRRSAWVKDVFDSDDWIERRYSGPDGTEILLFVARSYDPKRLYHHPELGVLHGTDLAKVGTVGLPSLNGAPAHALKARTGRGVAAYSLLYDCEWVDSPIALQLQTAWELLFSARKPMTLFLVYDRQWPADEPFATSPAARVLAEAMISFRSQASSVSHQRPSSGSGSS